MDTTEITPRVTAEQEECGCYGGYHYLGYVVELPDGEEDVEYKAVPCKRCGGR